MEKNNSSTNQKKVLFLRYMKSDFVFSASYINKLAEIVQDLGLCLYVYDTRKRKLINFSNRNVICFGEYFSILDSTPLRFIVNLIYLIMFCRKYKNYFLAVHVLYVRFEFMMIPNMISKLGEKLILSVFGSDVNSLYNFKKYFSKIFFMANIVHLSTEKLFIYLVDKYGIKREFLDKKKLILMYPLETLQYLNISSQKTNHEGLPTFNLYADDFVVVCGNNASFDLEQTYKLTNEISKIDSTKYKNIKLVFQLTYGNNDKEIAKFIEYAKKVMPNMVLVFLTKFLSVQQIVKLRTITDIYINVRRTDQLVGTMIESFFSKSDIITGKWLNYKEIRDIGFQFTEIDKLTEIVSILPSVIENRMGKKNQKYLIKNYELAQSLWNYDTSVKDWTIFYKELFTQ